MLDDATQERIGRQLRTLYEMMPKGGIPERIWVLLLLIEHDWTVRAQQTRSPFPSGKAA